MEFVHKGLVLVLIASSIIISLVFKKNLNFPFFPQVPHNDVLQMGQVKKKIRFLIVTIKEYGWDLSQQCFSSKYVSLYFVVPVMNRDRGDQMIGSKDDRIWSQNRTVWKVCYSEK